MTAKRNLPMEDMPSAKSSSCYPERQENDSETVPCIRRWIRKETGPTLTYGRRTMAGYWDPIGTLEATSALLQATSTTHALGEPPILGSAGCQLLPEVALLWDDGLRTQAWCFYPYRHA
mmetsp:Transcript_36386/g.70663  ORF Transcript_36386/g.70663 Transcript_36386/m.70663 type:complete len:119 (-) Transcript_36386:410-766(-)